MNDAFNKPLPPHEETVLPEWVDYNGHMNLAYYVVVFDHAADAFLEHVGLGKTYAATSGHSVFVVETHVVYRRELMAGERVRVESRLIGFDAKRIHLYHAMHRPGDAELAATSELLFVHVDTDARRAVSFPEATAAGLEAFLAAQGDAALPADVGRAIGLGPDRAGG